MSTRPMEPHAPAAAGGGSCERAEAVAGPVLPGGASGGRAAAREPGPETAGGGRKGRREAVPLRLRLGRARRRAGPGTPAPSWKMTDDEAAEGEAVSLAAPARQSSASARQLGASLWEIHDVALGGRRRRRVGKGLASSGREGADGVHESDQGSDGFGGRLAHTSMKHHKLHDESSHRRQRFCPASCTGSTGSISPARSLDVKGGFGATNSSRKTSTELLKVLNRIWSLEEQHTANLSVVNGLRLELQQAKAHIQELMQERRLYHHDISSLMRQLSENKVVEKNKEHGKIEAAVQSLQGELADERCLRRHSEDLHRKLGKEISEIKSAFLKAVKDLEKEKKSHHLLEELCDQFAMGIRNYEDEVKAVKQRHVKNYELNFDTSVLHIAETWLDERVQMQNVDIKEDLAQKATITDRLSSEIQAFLLSKRSGSSKDNEKYMKDNTIMRRQSLESVHLNGVTSAPQVAEDDDDSVASDLHCFELNMHGNGICNYDHMGPRRSCRASMDAPKRRSEDIHGITAEGSHLSCVPICSHKDITRSSSSNLQHATTKIPGIDPHSNAGVTIAEEQNRITSTHIPRGSHNDASKNNPEAPHVTCLGQESFDHYSRTSLFCEGTTSGDLGNLGSPTQQLTYPSTSLDPEILEFSPEPPIGVMGNSLKQKLLQARLEGRHARLKASGGSSTSRRNRNAADRCRARDFDVHRIE